MKAEIAPWLRLAFGLSSETLNLESLARTCIPRDSAVSLLRVPRRASASWIPSPSSSSVLKEAPGDAVLQRLAF
jgi:hypothetical protein